jgi:hypothetical protein
LLTVERRLSLLSYKSIYFATQADLDRVVANIKRHEIIRFFYTDGTLTGSRVLRHEPAWTVCNDLTQPLEQIWHGFVGYNRAEIRKAERLGDRVRIVVNGSIPDFLQVFNSFAQLKDEVTTISERVLKRYEHIADRLILFLDEKPAVVNLVIRDPVRSRVRGLYNASLRLAVEERKEARLLGNLNRLLHWHNMQHYKREGFAIYDWGGVSSDLNDGRAKFKLSFGGDLVHESIYMCSGWIGLGLVARRMLQLLTTLRTGR